MQGVAIGWAVPILTGFLVYMAVGVPEWRVRRAERAKALGGMGGAAHVPPVRGELISMWLASAEKARKSFSGSKSQEVTKK